MKNFQWNSISLVFLLLDLELNFQDQNISILFHLAFLYATFTFTPSIFLYYNPKSSAPVTSGLATELPRHLYCTDY